MTIYSKINAVNTHRSMETVVPDSIELTDEEVTEVYNVEAEHKAGRYANVRKALRNTPNKGMILFATQNGLISEVSNSDLFTDEILSQAFIVGFEKKNWDNENIPATTVFEYIRMCLRTDPFRIIATMDSSPTMKEKINASFGLIFSGELKDLIDGKDNKALDIICNKNSIVISSAIGTLGKKSISNTLKSNIDFLSELVQDEKRYGDAAHIPFEITATIAGFIID